MISRNRKQHALHCRVREQWPYFPRVEKRNRAGEFLMQKELDEKLTILFESLNDLATGRVPLDHVRPGVIRGVCCLSVESLEVVEFLTHYILLAVLAPGSMVMMGEIESIHF